MDIKRSLCRKLAKQIAKQTDVKIWHLDGIIFHMTQDDKVLLSHEYLRPHYRSNRLARQDTWLAIGFIFWALMFKSFANAISPGTFTKDQE